MEAVGEHAQKRQPTSARPSSGRIRATRSTSGRRISLSGGNHCSGPRTFAASRWVWRARTWSVSSKGHTDTRESAAWLLARWYVSPSSMATAAAAAAAERQDPRHSSKMSARQCCESSVSELAPSRTCPQLQLLASSLAGELVQIGAGCAPC